MASGVASDSGIGSLPAAFEEGDMSSGRVNPSRSLPTPDSNHSRMAFKKSYPKCSLCDNGRSLARVSIVENWDISGLVAPEGVCILPPRARARVPAACTNLLPLSRFLRSVCW